MALADTGKAISHVTGQIQYHLALRLVSPKVPSGFQVTVGRPETTHSTQGLNLFLYEAVFDASLKNFSIIEGQPPPLWLVLRYLLTPFAGTQEKDSDSLKALEYLGLGVQVLQDLNFPQLTATYREALEENPEPLKITFLDATVDLLSKFLQSNDEKYHFSIPFEVRPVMIAPELPPESSLLVGMDYSKISPSPRVDEEMGVHIDVTPSLGPVVSKVEPLIVDLEDRVTVSGQNLQAGNLGIALGNAGFEFSAQAPGQVMFDVTGEVADGQLVSAGSLPLSVVKQLSNGRLRSSNPVILKLRPKLTDVVVANITSTPHPFDTGKVVVTARLTLQGNLLGAFKDDVVLAFYKDGQVAGFVDASGHDPADIATTEPQKQQKELVVGLKKEHKLAAGEYRLILIVNGQQAKYSPLVNMVP